MIRNFDDLGPYQQYKYTIVSNENVLHYAEKIFRKVHVGRLALYDKEYPYVFPLTHFYEEGFFYWHCTFKGKKTQLIKENPKATYVIDGPVKSLGDNEKICTQSWLSVICYGEAHEVGDVFERERALRNFTAYYGGAAAGLDQRAKVTNVVKFSIDKMTVRYGRITPVGGRTLMLWSFKDNLPIEATGEMNPLPEI